MYYAAQILSSIGDYLLEQASVEVQLQVWKELAISKQVLMQTAATALGLPEEYTTEELELALNKTIKLADNAEAEIKAAQAKAEQAIAEMQLKIEQAEKATKVALAEKEQALAEKDAAEQSMEANRSQTADELKKAKAQLADKQKEIKQITKVLADTPENVVKKMKALKKEKMDESKAKKAAEDLTKKLRKEKQTVETTVAEQKEILAKAVELIEDYRTLNKHANEQFDQLAELVEDKEKLAKVPAINDEIVELIEKSVDEKKDKK